MKDWLHKKFMVKLLELNDPPEKVARGVAVGTFVSITPTGGIQTVIAVVLATIMKGNRLAAALFTWISNPVTMIPICWLNYTLGAVLMRKPFLSWSRIEKLVERQSVGLIAGILEVLRNIAHIFIPMLLGSIIIGIILGLVAYLITLPLLRSHHEKKEAKKLEQHHTCALQEGSVVSCDSVSAKSEPPLQDRRGDCQSG